MPQKLKVSHSNFWKRFRVEGSIFHRALEVNFDVEFVPPSLSDLDFTSCFYSKKLMDRFNRMRSRPNDQKQVLFLGEPVPIEAGRYDGVISGNYLKDEQHFRLPLWILYCNFFGETTRVVDQVESQYKIADFLNRPSFSDWSSRKDLFSAVFSNAQYYRIDMLNQLKKLGEGRVGGPIAGLYVDDKIEFIRHSKINLCFENTSMPGYHTEKPIQASIAGCVPLWFGDEAFVTDFQQGSLVNAKDFAMSAERILDEVDLYQIAQTPMLTSVPEHFFTGLVEFLKNVVESDSSRKCLGYSV